MTEVTSSNDKNGSRIIPGDVVEIDENVIGLGDAKTARIYKLEGYLRFDIATTYHRKRNGRMEITAFNCNHLRKV